MRIKLWTTLGAGALFLAMTPAYVARGEESQTAKTEESAKDAARQQMAQAVLELKQQLQQIQKQQEVFQAQEKALAEQKAQFEEQRKLFEKRHAEMEQQKARFEVENRFRDAPRAGANDVEQVLTQPQKDAQQAAKAAQLLFEQRQKSAPLPDDAAIRVFKLQYVKPNDIGQALQKITGGGGPRVAVDERTEALLIAGTDKQIAVAEQLVQSLDQPGKAQMSTGPETLQVRIVWLLDQLNDRSQAPPKPTIVTPEVLDALHELGFERPSVACQQLSTLTLSSGDRKGVFSFEVPTLIEGSPWQFEGQGKIAPTTDNRYALEFDINVVQPNNTQHSQVGGSIVTSLDHYTVLGTSTFVGPQAADDKGGGQAEHLSAFVVYVDRAKGFASGTAEKSEAKPQEKR